MTRAVTYVEIDVPSFVVDSPESIETYRFAIATSYLSNAIECIPSIDNISFTPQRISLGENLGQRASLKVTFRDHRHVFAGEDYTSGTFFGKWRARYGNKLRGRALRIYRGTEGQAIADMEVRHYVVDSCNGPLADAAYTITAKDPLKYADDDRAQAPYISNGSLAGSITISATTAYLSPTGIGDLEYPATGYVCIAGKEIVGFTRVSDTLTITRGQLGTTAEAHDASDRVQIVLRYTGNDVADIVYDLLVNYASVPAEYINLTEWQTETSDYMYGLLYASNISEATSVKTLLNELVQQAVITLYWDDRANKIRLKVIRQIATDADLFDDYNIIENSFGVTEQDSKRLSEVWCYYTQRNSADGGAKEDNYRNILVDVDLARETQYGGSMIRKTQCRWIQTEAAASRYTTVQLGRYADPPRSYAFDVVSGTAVSPAGGYTVQWWGEQDETGARVSVPVQVTQVTIYSDRVHVEAEETLVPAATGSSLLNVVFLNEGSGTYTRPATWNDANNSIHCIGAGGSGGSNTNWHGGGGGGGAYASISNYTMAATESYTVGAGGVGVYSMSSVPGNAGAASWFATTGTVYANPGGGGGTTTAGAGGLASTSVGTTKYAGGAGSPGDGYGGAGGGAGGPNGAGAAGGTSPFQYVCGAGGGGADGGSVGVKAPDASVGGVGGANRFGFGGGTSGTPTGQEGGGGKGCDTATSNGGNGGAGEQIWTQTIAPITSAGPGGGAGGGATSVRYGVAFDGGAYGGGGGAASPEQTTGSGADGLIVLVWRTA
jgi:hypothetical protein